MLLILATLITCFVIGCNDQQNEDSENVTNGTGEKLPGSDGGPASESDGNDRDILRFLSKSFEYDGNEHTISITGKLPDGAEVTYTGGENGKNGATNLGTYTVNATITVPGSDPLVLTAEIKIVPKARDLSPSYNGEALMFSDTFTVLTSQDQSYGYEFNITDLVEKDNLGDDRIAEAVANRNRIIKKNFGIEIKRAATASFYEELNYAVDSSDDSYDVAMASIRDGMNLAVRSRPVDFNTANYIDFTQGWWDQGIAEDLSLAGGTYLAIGDLCTVDKEATWCVLFNADILATKNKGLSESELHRIVKSGIGCHGGWTLEYLMVVAQLHSTAENDPEKNIWDPGYQGTGNYGLFTQKETAVAFLTAGGYTPTVRSDGPEGIKSNINSMAFEDAVFSVWQLFGNITNSNWFLDLDEVVGEDPADGWQNIAYSGFMKGKAAFYVTRIGTVKKVREMDYYFGILPLPKLYNTQTEYANTVQYENAQCYVIPKRANEVQTDKISYILEAMAYYSSEEYAGEKSLHSEYYSSLLRGKATPEDDIRQMLDIVFENRIYDFPLSLNIRNINEAIENTVSGPSFEWMPYKVSLLGNFDEAVKNTLNGVL